MDNRSFDAVSRSFGSTGTRRGILGFIASAAAIVAFGGDDADAKKKKGNKGKKKCEEWEVRVRKSSKGGKKKFDCVPKACDLGPCRGKCAGAKDSCGKPCADPCSQLGADAVCIENTTGGHATCECPTPVCPAHAECGFYQNSCGNTADCGGHNCPSGFFCGVGNLCQPL